MRLGKCREQIMKTLLGYARLACLFLLATNQFTKLSSLFLILKVKIYKANAKDSSLVTKTELRDLLVADQTVCHCVKTFKK